MTATQRPPTVVYDTATMDTPCEIPRCTRVIPRGWVVFMLTEGSGWLMCRKCTQLLGLIP